MRRSRSGTPTPPGTPSVARLVERAQHQRRGGRDLVRAPEHLEVHGRPRPGGDVAAAVAAVLAPPDRHGDGAGGVGRDRHVDVPAGVGRCPATGPPARCRWEAPGLERAPEADHPCGHVGRRAPRGAVVDDRDVDLAAPPRPGPDRRLALVVADPGLAAVRLPAGGHRGSGPRRPGHPPDRAEHDQPGQQRDHEQHDLGAGAEEPGHERTMAPGVPPSGAASPAHRRAPAPR